MYLFIEIVVFKTLRVNETTKEINVDREDKRIKNWVLSPFKLRNPGEKEVKEVRKEQQ